MINIRIFENDLHLCTEEGTPFKWVSFVYPFLWNWADASLTIGGNHHAKSDLIFILLLYFFVKIRIFYADNERVIMLEYKQFIT